jgi:hypothetical protein
MVHETVTQAADHLVANVTASHQQIIGKVRAAGNYPESARLVTAIFHFLGTKAAELCMVHANRSDISALKRFPKHRNLGVHKFQIFHGRNTSIGQGLNGAKVTGGRPDTAHGNTFPNKIPDISNA